VKQYREIPVRTLEASGENSVPPENKKIISGSPGLLWWNRIDGQAPYSGRRRRAAAAFPDSTFSTIYRGVTVIFHSQTLYVLKSQYVELIFYGAGFFGIGFVLMCHTVKVAGVFRSGDGGGGGVSIFLFF